MGLSAKKTILDKGDQIFGNKTHIENGIFVSKCTRKDRPKTSEPTSGELDTNKILLEKYSTVIYVNETYTVPIKALPKGYSQKDLIYRTSKPDVASVTDGVINGLSQGASEITISTSDGKYYAALNILVSTG